MYISDWIKEQEGGFFPLGERALLIQLPRTALGHVHAFARYLIKSRLKGLIELVPAFDSVNLLFDARQTDHSRLIDQINRLEAIDFPLWQSGFNKHEIPVCYELGLDTGFIAQKLGADLAEIIKSHSQRTYTVAMIGFLPGFLYLSGMNSCLELPRRRQVRKIVPRGAVGIGGMQTGIYSLPSPGGWHILGLTPLNLLDLSADPPFAFQAGDEVHFRPISEQEYHQLNQKS